MYYLGDYACPGRNYALEFMYTGGLGLPRRGTMGELCLPTEWCIGTIDPKRWYFDHGGTLTTRHLLPDPLAGQAYITNKSLTS